MLLSLGACLRFLMSLFMYSHGITKDTHAFIPVLDTTRRSTDEGIFSRCELAKEDIVFIESRIRPMESPDE